MTQRDLTPLPVHVLTGFLGAGKTTLLNALLRAPGLADTAVIVNEFGEIGLDHLLVGSARDTVVLLDSGCLCCAMEGSLRETLANLYARRAAGDIPKFHRVLIETSGLAEPAPILETLLADPVLAGFYAPGALLCVVDALHGMATLDQSGTARAQAALADTILISKADLAGGLAPALLTRLTALNHEARVIDGAAALGDPLALLRDHGRPPGARPASPHHHDHDIVTHAFHLSRTVSWAGIAAWTGHLAARWGDALLRTKALFDVGAPGPVLVQGVRSRFETKRLEAWPDDVRGARIVLIGQHLDRPDVILGLNWLAAPAGEPIPASAQFPNWPPITETLPHEL